MEIKAIILTLECDTKLGLPKIGTIFEIPKPKDYFVGHKKY